MKLTIIIRGVGLVYANEAEQTWNVRFPFDDCHKVKLRLAERDTGIPLATAGRTINIRTVGAATSQFEFGEHFNEFLDVTSDVAHKDGIKSKDNIAGKSVTLSVKDSKFGVYEFTRCRFRLMDGQNEVVAPRVFGYSGKVEIEGEEVIVELNDALPGFPKSFKNDSLLIFDNICPPAPQVLGPANEILGDLDVPSDFEMMYEIVEDKTEPDKKFVVDRDPAQKPGAPGIVFTGLTFQDNIAEGEPGMPCNLFVASKPPE